VTAEPLGHATSTRDVTIEGEADGVEHGGLAGTGRTGEQEEPGFGEGIEVDRDLVGKRTERLDLEVMEAHQETSSSRSGSALQESQASRKRAASLGEAS